MRAFFTLFALAAAVAAQSSASHSESAAGSAAPSGSKPATPSGSLSGSAPNPSQSLPPTLTPCAGSCINAALALSPCNLITNVTCVCTNADFQARSTSCLQTECAADDVKAAVAIQQAQCGAASLSATVAASGSATAPFHPVNSFADINGTSVFPSASGNASVSPSGKPAAGVALTTPGFPLAAVVAAVGGLIGAAIVL